MIFFIVFAMLLTSCGQNANTPVQNTEAPKNTAQTTMQEVVEKPVEMQNAPAMPEKKVMSPQQTATTLSLKEDDIISPTDFRRMSGEDIDDDMIITVGEIKNGFVSFGMSEGMGGYASVYKIMGDKLVRVWEGQDVVSGIYCDPFIRMGIPKDTFFMKDCDAKDVAFSASKYHTTIKVGDVLNTTMFAELTGYGPTDETVYTVLDIKGDYIAMEEKDDDDIKYLAFDKKDGVYREVWNDEKYPSRDHCELFTKMWMPSDFILMKNCQ